MSALGRKILPDQFQRSLNVKLPDNSLSICETTRLRTVTLLDSRQPDEVSRKFQLAWARAFGYPLRLTADPDGSFRSTFEDDMNNAGVCLNYVPPESHDKMGLV